ATDEQRVELPCRFERVEILAAAHVSRADEDLRHGAAPVCPTDHLNTALGLPGDVDLAEGDPFAFEQFLRRTAKIAIIARIDLHRCHSSPVRSTVPDYMGARTASTTRASVRTSTRAAP